MTLYTKILTIPASTKEPMAARADIDLPTGIVDRLDIVFPPGHADDKIRIMDGKEVIYPKEPDIDDISDSSKVSKEAYTMCIGGMFKPDSAKKLTIEGLPRAATDAHDITVRFYTMEKR